MELSYRSHIKCVHKIRIIREATDGVGESKCSIIVNGGEIAGAPATDDDGEAEEGLNKDVPRAGHDAATDGH